MIFLALVKVLVAFGVPMLIGAALRDAAVRVLKRRDQRQYFRALAARRTELLGSASKDELLTELSKRDLQ